MKETQKGGKGGAKFQESKGLIPGRAQQIKFLEGHMHFMRLPEVQHACIYIHVWIYITLADCSAMFCDQVH